MVEFFYVFSQPPLSKSGGLAVGCFMLVSMLILQFHVLQPCEVWVCFLHVFFLAAIRLKLCLIESCVDLFGNHGS